MNILYSVSFQPSLTSGKNLAAYEKIISLEKKFDKVIVCSISQSTLIKSIFEYFYNEIFILYLLLFRKIDVAICRGPTGVLGSIFFKNKIVREIHADLKEELKILSKSSFKYTVFSAVNTFCEFRSIAHIYNNPLLIDHYKIKGYAGKQISVYNGVNIFRLKNILLENGENYKKKYGKYLIFTGSCSVWHDLITIEKIGKYFISIGIKVIVAGGKFDSPHVINISPCSYEESIKLISQSIGTLVFINNIRVSPGNALKIYEYMALGKKIIANNHLIGYSDELGKYAGSCLIDPANIDYQKIREFILSNVYLKYNFPNEFYWDQRIGKWNDFIKTL